MVKFIAAVLIFLITGTATASPVVDTQAIWQAQRFELMQQGIYVVPEEVINAYFAEYVKANPKVKESTVTILPDNKIVFHLVADGVGDMKLYASVKEFHYDKDTALLELYLEKKELVGHPVVSWFMSHLSAGLLTKIYGNPLATSAVKGKISGNSVVIDLKPFTSALVANDASRDIAEALVISHATTMQGAVQLHTNMSLGQVVSSYKP